MNTARINKEIYVKMKIFLIFQDLIQIKNLNFIIKI